MTSRKNSRQKGKRTERYLANKLRVVWPNIRRNAGTQSQSGGVDLEETGCFDFECKSGKAIKKVEKWIDQVEHEGKKENYKAVLFKPDRKPGWVALPLDDFVQVLVNMKAEGII